MNPLEYTKKTVSLTQFLRALSKSNNKKITSKHSKEACQTQHTIGYQTISVNAQSIKNFIKYCVKNLKIEAETTQKINREKKQKWQKNNREKFRILKKNISNQKKVKFP